MERGIAIVGLNGSGKSTLNHMLARELGYLEMDVEDYYFPQQKAHRQWALEHAEVRPAELPYTAERDQAEVEAALLGDMEVHPRFVLSCVRLNWCEVLRSRLDMVFWLQVPLETRLERIRQREKKRFGARALPGGDMYGKQEAFRRLISKREPAMVEESLKELRCPVVMLDGTRPLEENLRVILACLQDKTGSG
ncbi:MAG: AAA family ATPase [Clostridia bacterium]|nr:AAA family ATPase [Clostridia bacterium]